MVGIHFLLRECPLGWSSLDVLRACQLRAYDVAQDYDRRCSLYPEYQCVPVEQHQTRENATVRQDKNKDTQTNNARRPGLKPLVPADAGTQTANAK